MNIGIEKGPVPMLVLLSGTKYAGCLHEYGWQQITVHILKLIWSQWKNIKKQGVKKNSYIVSRGLRQNVL